MDSLKAERRALRALVLSAVLFVGTVFIAQSSTSSFRWLLPLSTFFIVMVWLELWRDRRRARAARSKETA